MNANYPCLHGILQGLTKSGDDYDVKAAHVELAERMRKVSLLCFPCLIFMIYIYVCVCIKYHMLDVLHVLTVHTSYLL